MKPTRKKNQKSNRYWLVGVHAAMAAFANPNRVIHRAVATRNALNRIENPKYQARCELVDPAVIDRLAGADSVHQGIALEVDALEYDDLGALDCGTRPLLLLDQVTDPHNVGAILRSAAAFDVAAVVQTNDHAAPESAAMAKAASGALDLVPRVTVTNLAQAISQVQAMGYWVIGLDGEAKSPLSVAVGGGSGKKSAKIALVLGAEGKGLRRLTAECCDELAFIPMHPQMESLNVSNAAAISLYELGRNG